MKIKILTSTALLIFLLKLCKALDDMEYNDNKKSNSTEKFREVENPDKFISLYHFGLEHLTNPKEVLKFYHLQSSNPDFIYKMKKLISLVNESPNLTQKVNITGLIKEFLSPPPAVARYKNENFKRTDDWTLLQNLYTDNKLITSRLGLVESKFLNHYLFNVTIPFDKFDELIVKNGYDYRMRANAGLFYKNSNHKKFVLKWWTHHAVEILKKSSRTLTCCLRFLFSDVLLWAQLGFLGSFSSVYILVHLILKNSEGKKIIFIGQATESMELGYKNLHKLWKFPVTNFTFSTVQMPQTTLKLLKNNKDLIRKYNSMADIVNEKLREIIIHHSDFDTAIFSCGAYGPPLMNLLNKKFGDTKNLIYLGSEVYRMFGVEARGIKMTDPQANMEFVIPAVEKFNQTFGDIDDGKYWS